MLKIELLFAQICDGKSNELYLIYLHLLAPYLNLLSMLTLFGMDELMHNTINIHLMSIYKSKAKVDNQLR